MSPYPKAGSPKTHVCLRSYKTVIHWACEHTYGHVWIHVVTWAYIWSCINMHVATCEHAYGHVRFHVVMCEYPCDHMCIWLHVTCTWSCEYAYGCVNINMVLWTYSCVWTCMWSCVNMHMVVWTYIWSCVNMHVVWCMWSCNVSLRYSARLGWAFPGWFMGSVTWFKRQLPESWS